MTPIDAIPLDSLDRLQGSGLVMTQRLIASRLGVRRKGVTDAALKPQSGGVIRCARGHFHGLDRDGLERHTGACRGAVKREYDRLVPAELAQQPGASSSRRAKHRAGGRSDGHRQHGHRQPQRCADCKTGGRGQRRLHRPGAESGLVARSPRACAPNGSPAMGCDATCRARYSTRRHRPRAGHQPGVARGQDCCRAGVGRRPARHQAGGGDDAVVDAQHGGPPPADGCATVAFRAVA